MAYKIHCDFCDAVFEPKLLEGFRWKVVFKVYGKDICPSCKKLFIEWLDQRCNFKEKGTGEN